MDIKSGAIGIIGGTGIYDPDVLAESEKKKVHTPHGAPSDLLTIGRLREKKVVILPRHGSDHHLPPHKVNYRANIWAMKELGVSHIIAPSAVGSLKEEIRPGEFVFTDQFIDRTYGRHQTFYEEGQVCHISVADPFCPHIRKILIKTAEKLSLAFHKEGTCVVINGPRFSTKAESLLFRSWDASIINMTMCPEAVLAREAEICYASIAMVTDYDVWKEHEVTQDMVAATMKQNIGKVKKLLMEVIPLLPLKRECCCNRSLAGALV